MPSRKETTKETRVGLYSAARYLTADAREELGIRIPFDVYLQDPLVAHDDPKYGFEELLVRWEPGISDGPTSARFAVVDYNNDTDHLAPMAQWNEVSDCFVDAQNFELDRNNKDSLQYDQVHVWATLQRALEFFEDGAGLGRPIPYGFEGNRLIVVPHAGYGQNAFYDRKSKSLQFYYFDEGGERVNTCLSTDIVNHEFGHAVLDGVRPYYYESSLVETGAFHEFIGDLSAILLLLRNNTFRGRIAEDTGGNLSQAEHLSNIAEQFGEAVSGKPYLRTAQNQLKMTDISDDDGPHTISQVLTGAMFDILMALSDQYVQERNRSPKQAFWDSIQRMQRMAIQPLDLLPPVDVTFRDYAMAVLRAEQIANPTDPYNYLGMMLRVFRNRKILNRSDEQEFKRNKYVFDRLRIGVPHSIDSLSRSRAAAYRFLDDNRPQLLIPPSQDVIVADLYDAKKTTRQHLSLPRQIILQYIWREEVTLTGKRFGEYENQVTTMLCGGTLVFDEDGNVLSWSRKPGLYDGGHRWQDEHEAGSRRQKKFLDDLAKRISSGQVGAVLGSGKGMLGSHVPPLTVSRQDDLLQFNLSPHMHLVGEDHDHFEGGHEWEVSS